MKAACYEDDDLNYQELKCVNNSQIIYLINYQTLKFYYLRFTKNDFTTVRSWTREGSISTTASVN